jgi:hypothetical protein
MDTRALGTPRPLRLPQQPERLTGSPPLPSDGLASRGPPPAAQSSPGAAATPDAAQPRPPDPPGQRSHRLAGQLLHQHPQVRMQPLRVFRYGVVSFCCLASRGTGGASSIIIRTFALGSLCNGNIRRQCSPEASPPLSSCLIILNAHRANG